MKLTKLQQHVLDTIKQTSYATLPAKKKNEKALQDLTSMELPNGIHDVVESLKDLGLVDYEQAADGYVSDIHATAAPKVKQQ